MPPPVFCPEDSFLFWQTTPKLNPESQLCCRQDRIVDKPRLSDCCERPPTFLDALFGARLMLLITTKINGLLLNQCVLFISSSTELVKLLLLADLLFDWKCSWLEEPCSCYWALRLVQEEDESHGGGFHFCLWWWLTAQREQIWVWLIVLSCLPKEASSNWLILQFVLLAITFGLIWPYFRSFVLAW